MLKGVRDLAARGVQKALALMENALANLPVFNRGLVENARAIDLPDLVRTIEEALATAKEARMPPARLQEIEKAYRQISEVAETLAKLVAHHDLWQAADIELRRIDGMLRKDVDELVENWEALRRQMAELDQPGEQRVEAMHATARGITEAVATHDEPKLRKLFLTYRAHAIQRFSRRQSPQEPLCAAARGRRAARGGGEGDGMSELPLRTPNPRVAPNPPAATDPPTFGTVRKEHNRLLLRQRVERTVSEFHDEVEQFVDLACSAGAYMQLDEYRDATQALIDYWAATLYRENIQVDGTLREFDPRLVPPEGECPYRGLEPFRESDAGVFFGRERVIEQMRARLREHRFLAVLGPSGCGKSSAVRAGLIPALKAEGRYASFVTILPGSQPLAALAQILTPPSAVPDADAWRSAQIPLFRSNASHLRTMLSPAAGGAVFLYVDQFEELFTMTVDTPDQRAFVANLLALSEAEDAAHAVVISVRSDYETRLAKLKGLQEAVDLNQVRIPPMSQSELRRAIEAPAEAAGLEIEPALTDRLIDDIVGSPAALPLLQLALYKVWQERHRNLLMYRSYEKLGGATRALERTADRLYEELIEEDRAAARLILLRMVRARTGEEPTSHRVRRRDLHRISVPRERIDKVLRKLAENGLVRRTRGQTQDDDQFEVAHEALVRNWPMLVRWIEEERAKLTALHRIEALADEWILQDRVAGFLDAKQLEDAEKWMQESSATLGSTLAVQEFVQASRTELRRHRRNKRILWITLAAVAAGVIVGGFLLFREASRLELEATRLERDAERAAKQAEKRKAEAAADRERRQSAERLYAAVRDSRSQTEFVAALEMAFAESQLKLISKIDEAESLQARINALEQRLAESEAQRKDASEAANIDQASVNTLIATLRKEREMRWEKEREIDLLKAAKGPVAPAPHTETLKAEGADLRRKRRPIQPATSVSSVDRTAAGSITCVVRDASGRRYLLAPASILGEDVGKTVAQPALVDGGSANETVAVLWRTGGAGKAYAIAQILPEVESNGAVPGIGTLDGTEDTVPVGQSLRAVGRASGQLRGKSSPSSPTARS